MDETKLTETVRAAAECRMCGHGMHVRPVPRDAYQTGAVVRFYYMCSCCDTPGPGCGVARGETR